MRAEQGDTGGAARRYPRVPLPTLGVARCRQPPPPCAPSRWSAGSTGVDTPSRRPVRGSEELSAVAEELGIKLPPPDEEALAKSYKEAPARRRARTRVRGARTRRDRPGRARGTGSGAGGRGVERLAARGGGHRAAGAGVGSGVALPCPGVGEAASPVFTGPRGVRLRPGAVRFVLSHVGACSDPAPPTVAGNGQMSDRSTSLGGPALPQSEPSGYSR